MYAAWLSVHLRAQPLVLSAHLGRSSEAIIVCMTRDHDEENIEGFMGARLHAACRVQKITSFKESRGVEKVRLANVS